ADAMDNDNAIKLSCIVHGEPNAKVFPVKIDKNETIGTLKIEIWKANRRAFHDYDATQLDIWRVDIDYTSQNSKRTTFQNDSNADIQSALEGVRADEMDDVADVFGDGPLPKKHIHVIVVPPPANRPSLISDLVPLQSFNVIVDPKRIAFNWPVDITTVTLQDLRDSIAAIYPEIEDIAVAMPVITVAAYGKWTAVEVLRNLLHLDFDTLDNLDKLDIENLSSSLSSEARTFLLNEDETAKKAFIENLKDIRGVFNGNVTKNEATTRNFINPFIIKAVSRLQTIYPTMFLAVEQAFSGSRGFGNLDYAVFFSTFAILVTEAKQHAIMAGLTQNLVQLHTASEKLKRKRDNSPVLSAVYGIVATGRTWIFVRWEGSPENPSVKISEEYVCSFKNEMINEINVLNIIITILTLQAAELVCQTNEDEKNKNEEGRESQHRCLNPASEGD
ncbi:937_t:CDS:2, partial [Paraglomus brasilianum]